MHSIGALKLQQAVKATKTVVEQIRKAGEEIKAIDSAVEAGQKA